MRGLLIKDLALLKNQKKMFMMVVSVFLIFAVTGALDTAFIMGYLPFIFCMYVMSSISYDEFDNGLSFLLVLPTTRKQYAVEKYIFGMGMGISGMVLAVILATILNVVKQGNAGLELWFPECLFTIQFLLLFIVIFLGIMIPVQLKFGSEKGRIVLFGVFMAIIGIGYLFSKYVKKLPVDFNGIMDILVHAKGWILFLVLSAVAAIILLISYGISVHIMEKKSFDLKISLYWTIQKIIGKIYKKNAVRAL